MDYCFPDEFPGVYEANKDIAGFKLFKSHELTTLMREMINDDEAVAISCFRDLRDVIVSIANKEGYSASYIAKKKLMVKDYIHYYNEVKALPNSYISKYEDFYANIVDECRNISKFLNLPINDSQFEDISQKLSYKNKNELLSSEEFVKFEGQNSKEYMIDKKTLVHSNHFGNIHPSSYKKSLKKETIYYIESEGGLWLLQRGYKVSFKGLVSYFVNLIKSNLGLKK